MVYAWTWKNCSICVGASTFVHSKKWKKNYQSGNTFSLNENLNYSEATSKMGKMSRDKLPVEKMPSLWLFFHRYVEIQHTLESRFSHVARTNDPIYNQHCGSTIRYNTKQQRTHTPLIRPFKRNPALENINLQYDTVVILSLESVSHQSAIISYSNWAVQRCDYINSSTGFLFHKISLRLVLTKGIQINFRYIFFG